MKGLLRYIIETKLGEPNHDRKGGQADWDCPNCGGRLYQYTPSEVYPDRWQCARCGVRGDVNDFLKLICGVWNYSRRLDLIEDAKARLTAARARRRA